jgi:hypothetical protein
MTNETLPFWVGSDSNSYYVMRLNGMESIHRMDGIPTLQRFSKELAFIGADDIKDWHFEGEDAHTTSWVHKPTLIEFAKKKWILLPQLEDLEDKGYRHRLVARELDLKNHSLVGPTVILQDWVAIFDVKSKPVSFSMDRLQSKLFIMTRYAQEDNHFLLRVVDRKMAPVFKREVTFPFDPAVFELLDWMITSTGTIYLSARIYEQAVPPSDKTTAIPYSTVLMAITAESDKIDVIKLDLPGTSFRKLKLTEDPSGTLHCFGFVSQSRPEVFEGWADISIDPFTKNITTKGPFTFPNGLLGTRGKSDREVQAFAFKNIAWRADKALEISGDFSKDETSVQFLAFRVDSSMQHIEAMTKNVSTASSRRFKGIVSPYQCLFFEDETILVYDRDRDTAPVTTACRWATGKKPIEELVPIFDGFKNGNRLLPHMAMKMDGEQFFVLGEDNKRRNHRIGIVKRK